MTVAIETHSLSKRYGRSFALDDVTLHVPEGAVYALVGANGAGKTTLIRLLMNMLSPSSGEAKVLGIASGEIAGKPLERIAFVSENQKTLEGFTVERLLDYLRPFYPDWDPELENGLVRQFGLPLQRKLKHLSRGMRMKAALASVLAYHPALIVLDEPFSGLDPLVRDELVESLKERRGETTIFLSSHDLSEIESFATHVGVLDQGRLLFSEQLSTLRDRFREVEVTANATAAFPANPPANWLNVQRSETSLRFVDAQFSETALDDLAALFPNAAKITAEPMTLRSIVVAIARAGRRQETTPERRGEAA